MLALLLQRMSARLLMIGDGPERQRIENGCRATANCSQIVWLGKMTRPEEIMAGCDLFVLPSESESFGLAALEAMACGLPVVSTDVGGLPEVNRHGVSGLLSPLGDAQAMADNAYAILHDPAVHERYREGALVTARDFDLRKVLPRYEALYEQVLATESV